MVVAPTYQLKQASCLRRSNCIPGANTFLDLYSIPPQLAQVYMLNYSDTRRAVTPHPSGSGAQPLLRPSSDLA
jgi:hypothetical protein